MTPPLLRSHVLVSLVPKTLEEAAVLLAEHILDNPSEPPYTLEFILEYAYENEYQAAAILHMIDLLRLRRQNVLEAGRILLFASNLHMTDLLQLRWKNILKAARVNPLDNIFRSIRFFSFALKLQKEMEEIFVELYKYSGDLDVFEEICRARFVTHRLIDKMIRARRKYQKENPPKKDAVQAIK